MRALAIVPVILFHLKVPGFSGGLVGVDIFFVISGYLITRGLIDRDVRGWHGLADFWERRARRVLPALVGTLLAVLIAGWAIFMPTVYRTLGDRVVADTVFLPNMLLWLQTGYFGPRAEFDPLVHTWSLAVEEQFYLVFPLVLIGLRRIRAERSPFGPLLILALASFAASVWLVADGRQTAAFYLAPPRAWELLLGALLACGYLPAVRRRWIAEGMALAGIAMITATIVLLRERHPFPAVNALWPCFGAAAILHASAAERTAVARVLAMAPLRAIGLISYSLYLVHWPIIVFTNYVLLRTPGPGDQAIMVFAMVALAAVSWRFVEQPVRRRDRVPRRRFVVVAVAAMLVTALAGLAVYLTNGVPQRFGSRFAGGGKIPLATLAPGCVLDRPGDRWRTDRCILGGATDRPAALLWGDSHAVQYHSAIVGARPALDTRLLLIGSSACTPIIDGGAPGRSECRRANDLALRLIARFDVRTVILSAHWQGALRLGTPDFATIAATVRELRARGLRVKIIGDNPVFADQPAYLAYRLDQQGIRTGYLPPENDPDINARLRALVPPGDFFDPGEALCRDGRCLVYDRGNLIMRDPNHLSPYGAALVLPRMRAFLEN